MEMESREPRSTAVPEHVYTAELALRQVSMYETLLAATERQLALLVERWPANGGRSGEVREDIAILYAEAQRLETSVHRWQRRHDQLAARRTHR